MDETLFTKSSEEVIEADILHGENVIDEVVFSSSILLDKNSLLLLNKSDVA